MGFVDDFEQAVEVVNGLLDGRGDTGYGDEEVNITEFRFSHQTTVTIP